MESCKNLLISQNKHTHYSTFGPALWARTNKRRRHNTNKGSCKIDVRVVCVCAFAARALATAAVIDAVGSSFSGRFEGRRGNPRRISLTM